MFNWNDLNSFLTLSRSSRLLKASKKLKIEPTTIARRIKRLEKSLNCNLFHKSPKGYFLTEKGYELTFLPSTYKDYPSRPRKIVDFVRWRASLGHALARLVVKEVTIQIAGAIPQIGPLFKLSLRRWFNFQEEQLKLHLTIYFL